MEKKLNLTKIKSAYLLSTLFFFSCCTNKNSMPLNHANISNKTIKFSCDSFQQVMPCSYFQILNNPNESFLYKGITNVVFFNADTNIYRKLTLSTNNGTVEKCLPYGDSYFIEPNRLGKCVVTVSSTDNGINRIIQTKTYNVQSLPDPIAYVGSINQRKCSKEALLSIGKVRSALYQTQRQLGLDVVEFTIVASVDGEEIEIKANGNEFNNAQIQLIKSLSLNQHLIIKNIKSQMPDSTIRDISPIVIQIE